MVIPKGTVTVWIFQTIPEKRNHVTTVQKGIGIIMETIVALDDHCFSYSHTLTLIHTDYKSTAAGEFVVAASLVSSLCLLLGSDLP